MMLAGPFASEAEPLLASLGMKTQVMGDKVGDAAAIKMIRSVMIKGIEAVTAECFLAAERAGLLDQVTASLKNNYPTLDWSKVSEYNIERMASHGIRRAAEMREVAETLRELGIEPLMTDGHHRAPAAARRTRPAAGHPGSGAARAASRCWRRSTRCLLRKPAARRAS